MKFLGRKYSQQSAQSTRLKFFVCDTYGKCHNNLCMQGSSACYNCR